MLEWIQDVHVQSIHSIKIVLIVTDFGEKIQDAPVMMIQATQIVHLIVTSLQVKILDAHATSIHCTPIALQTVSCSLDKIDGVLVKRTHST